MQISLCFYTHTGNFFSFLSLWGQLNTTQWRNISMHKQWHTHTSSWSSAFLSAISCSSAWLSCSASCCWECCSSWCISSSLLLLLSCSSSCSPHSSCSLSSIWRRTKNRFQFVDIYNLSLVNCCCVLLETVKLERNAKETGGRLCLCSLLTHS